MFDLLQDGSIAIDFTPPDSEPVRVVVKQPPTFGDYILCREKIEEVNRERQDLNKRLRDDPDVTVGDMQNQLTAFVEDSAIRWWEWVMVGDDNTKGLADPKPPEDTRQWPTYLASNDAVTQALTHWKQVPLAHGGTPAA